MLAKIKEKLRNWLFKDELMQLIDLINKQNKINSMVDINISLTYL